MSRLYSGPNVVQQISTPLTPYVYNATTTYEALPVTTTTTTTTVNNSMGPSYLMAPVPVISKTMSPLANGPIVFSPPRLQVSGNNKSMMTIATTGIASGIPKSMSVRQAPAFQSMSLKSGQPTAVEMTTASKQAMPNDWVTYTLENKQKGGIKFRPRGFSISSSRSRSVDWDIKDRYLIAMRSGPTECPDHILAKSRLFPKRDFTSPYVLYYFDETAPNKILLKNDVAKSDNKNKSTGGFCGIGGDDLSSSMVMVEDGALASASSSSSSASSTSSSSYTSSSSRRRVPRSMGGTEVASIGGAAPQYGVPVVQQQMQMTAPVVVDPNHQPVSQQMKQRARQFVASVAHPANHTTTTVTTTTRGAPVSTTNSRRSSRSSYTSSMQSGPRALAVSSTSSSSSRYAAAPKTTSRVPCCGGNRFISASSGQYYDAGNKSYSKYMAMGQEGYVTSGDNHRVPSAGVPPVYPYGPNRSVYTPPVEMIASTANNSIHRGVSKTSSGAVSRTSSSSSSDTSSMTSSSITSSSSSRPLAVTSSSRQVVQSVGAPKKSQKACCGYQQKDRAGSIYTDITSSSYTSSSSSSPTSSLSDRHVATHTTSRSGTTSMTSSYTASHSHAASHTASHTTSRSTKQRLSSSTSMSSSAYMDVGHNPYTGPVCASSGSSSGSVGGMPRANYKPANVSEMKRCLDYGTKKMFFDVDDLRVPRNGTGLHMLPTYSVSYRNYPVVCYDVVAPKKYDEFFSVRKNPGMFM